MNTPITDLLKDGATVVASSDRLARDLRVRYSQTMRESGKSAWASPPIFSYRSYIRSQWESLWEPLQLLHPQQELSLWLHAVEESEHGDLVLSRSALARQARQTGNRVIEYGIDLDDNAFASQDEIAFRSWRKTVREKLDKYGWVIEAELPGHLVEACSEGRWKPPPTMVLVGFIEVTPSQVALFAAMDTAGAIIAKLDSLQAHEPRVRASLCDRRADQYRHAACVIERMLKPYRDGQKEPPRICIAVPDLDAARDGIEDVFREHLAPYVIQGGDNAHRVCWRFARGLALKEHALVSVALDLLTLMPYDNDVEDVSRALLAPGIFRACTREARARIDFELRKEGGSRASLGSVAGLCKKIYGKHPESPLSAGLPAMAAWFETLAQTREQRLPSEWADWMGERLKAANWAQGDLSPEFEQALEAWDECLDMLRAMDRQVRALSYQRALGWLKEILSERRFQSSVTHIQPVQVLSYADLPGTNCDYLAVLDASADVLPARSRPSGLVALDAERAAGVPQSDPDLCHEVAERWLAHAHTLAPVVEFYCATFDDKGAQISPSPMISGWQTCGAEAERCQSHLQVLMNAGVAAQWPTQLGDCKVPAFDLAREDSGGGSQLLRDMVLSPLAAFLRERCRLPEFPGSEDGLRARTQGEVVHRVLELFWTETKTQHTMKALALEVRRQRIEALTLQAMETERLVSPERHGRALFKLECSRVIDLCLEWLDYEAQRVVPFEVVSIEQRTEAKVGPLSLKVRVDRIDKLTHANGAESFLVIDYKTGEGAKFESVWEPSKFAEPQLPLYATFADLGAAGVPRVDGIAFARVSEGNCGFVLKANFADRLVVSESKPDPGQGDRAWLMTVLGWKTAIEREVARYLEGNTQVDPVKFHRSRLHADLHGFLRNAAKGRR